VRCDCCFAQDGNTPLIIAAENGHLEVARLLLERDASVNAQNTVRQALQ
jgi:ankyrin repeat protein